MAGEQTDGKPYQETWLLLEFCDRGSLQDAMDRGAFRPVRLGEEGSKVLPPVSADKLRLPKDIFFTPF